MKFVTVLFAVVMSFQVYAEDCKDMVPLGKPVVTTIEKVTYLCRRMYVLEHSPSRKTAYWSAEHLLGTQQVLSGERKNYFKADPDLPKSEAASPLDYLKTGYDMGHMAPVGDMYADPVAMRESFYLSNMAPQVPGNNRIGWRWLEDYARQEAVKRNDVYVITGPIYKGTDIKTIGLNEVAVPTHFYKILYNAHTNVSLTFVFANVPFAKADIPTGITTLKNVEELTGIKFFPKAKSIIESSVMWQK